MTITSGGLDSRYDTLKQFLQEIDDAGVPFDGIGFQAHINSFPVGPTTVYSILEDFNQSFGKDLKITEFDMIGVSPNIHYEYVRDFLTIVFSHERVESFLCWGFWDGNHWLGDAPFYNLDWSIKPGGQAFLDLVFNEWWTNEVDTTSVSESAIFRPFKGKHKITVMYDGQIIEQEVTLSQDTVLDIIINVACGSVNNTNDQGPGSLRNAILCAEQGDTIIIPSILSNQTILLNSDKLIINKDLSIIADIADQIKIDGQSVAAVFETEIGQAVRLEGFQISCGTNLNGRGIWNEANLFLKNMLILENPDLVNSGGQLIVNKGQLTIQENVVLQK
jgi:hypothetical protein